MRARVAYISSLGTTAILVAAALLMLAVVGAIVAFKGWPGRANAAGVQSVPLGPALNPARTTLVITRAARARAIVRARPAAAATRRLSTAGLVKQVGPRVVSGVVMVPVRAVSPTRGTIPQSGQHGPIFPAPSGRDPAIGPLPPASPGGGSVDPARIVPVQLPNPSGPPPPADGLTVAVDQVVAQAPPPPGLR